MLETASDAKEGVPTAFAENVGGIPEWVFNLRRTLYCKAKQELKRRSQRPYRRPEDKTWYQHLKDLGVKLLTTQLRACES